MVRSIVSAIALLIGTALGESITLPNVLHDGPVTPEANSARKHVDWPKLTPGVNESTYDWWYFDAVSADADISATVVLYNGGPKGFINDYLGGPLAATLVGIFPNGTVYDIKLPATSAVLSRTDHGSFATSGVWQGTGFSFHGTSTPNGLVRYVINIDAPQMGVAGTMSLVSVAPAHYPCGPDKVGQKELIVPHVFWSNAIPDAVAEVDLVINGTAVKFQGAGYHDKNWGDAQFVTTVSTWYWGHARLGPYSLVWFDVFDKAGVEYRSGYIAKDGKMLLGSCAPGTVVARPWGANSDFPPKTSTPPVQGMEVQFELGHGASFWANITTTVPVVSPSGRGSYYRSLGTVTGGLGGQGCAEYEGISLFEEFKLTP